MKKILFIMMSLLLFSCSERQIGYLEYELGSYSEPVLNVRLELDDALGEPNPILRELYDRDANHPWLSEWFLSQYPTFESYVLANPNGVEPHYINSGLDRNRQLFKLPWQSTAIEGVFGTKPLTITLHNVVASDGGDEGALLEYIDVYSDGTIMLPYEHKVPLGTYTISLKLENRGHTGILEDCYTIKVYQNKEEQEKAEY